MVSKYSTFQGSYVKKGVNWTIDVGHRLIVTMYSLKSKSKKLTTKQWTNKCPICKKEKVLYGIGIRNFRRRKDNKIIKNIHPGGSIVCKYCGSKFCGVTGIPLVKKYKIVKKKKVLNPNYKKKLTKYNKKYTTKQKKAIKEAKKDYKASKPKKTFKLIIPATTTLTKLRDQTYCGLRNPLVSAAKNFWIDEITYTEDLRDMVLTDGPPEPEEEYTPPSKSSKSSSSGGGKLTDKEIRKAVKETNRKHRTPGYSACDCFCRSTRIFNMLKKKGVPCKIKSYYSPVASSRTHRVVIVKYSSGWKLFDYSGFPGLLKGNQAKALAGKTLDSYNGK